MVRDRTGFYLPRSLCRVSEKESLYCAKTSEEKQAYVEKISAQLYEHFDAVQILVSWNEESRCDMITSGSGNWYARQGMAHDFIQRDIAQNNASELSRCMPNEKDDGEDWKP